MLSDALPPAISSMPLYNQLMLAVIIASALLCLAVVATGALHKFCFCRTIAGLPPAPPTFPHTLDQIYTALFIAFILYGAAANLFPGKEKASQALGWGTLLLAISTHIALYLPMLVRYGLLHSWQRPSRPWRHRAMQVLTVWAIIYGSIILLEGSGFTSWLIEQTQCPEHQNLVTLFSQGDLVQKLYVAISAVLVAPVVEECCFRGFLYTSLKRWGGCAAAAIASALLFGAIHSSLAQLLPLTIFGIVQCIAYEKTRTLWLPIAVHAFFNSVSLVAAILTNP